MCSQVITPLCFVESDNTKNWMYCVNIQKQDYQLDLTIRNNFTRWDISYEIVCCQSYKNVRFLETMKLKPLPKPCPTNVLMLLKF